MGSRPRGSNGAAIDLPSCVRVALAISGGPDSLALLVLAAQAGHDIVAATVDHRLRPDAAEEAEMVAQVCARLGVAHRILTIDVPDDPAGLQAAAREARYAALGLWAAEQGARFLATAHHRDDQAETVLMRLARGAGLAGLAGIRRSRPLDQAPGITLIRPLLDRNKAELEAIVAAAGLTPVRDPSNADPRFDRTRARALLAGGWPLPERIAAAADHLGEAEAALDWSARQLARDRIAPDDCGIAIDVTNIPREHRRRLLLAGIAGIDPDVRPRGDSLDRLLRALDAGEVATLAGIRVDPGPPWRLTRAAPRRSV